MSASFSENSNPKGRPTEWKRASSSRRNCATRPPKPRRGNLLPSIAECAVVGVDDQLKGHVPITIIVTKNGIHTQPEFIEKEIVAKVREIFGAVAPLKHVFVAERLP
ncbi:MAG: propionyl-CoA synthetase [Symploca sp. SIO1A3]|nr:propionyl-CoA synthetase [Symploca sp. SIO1A3]